MKMQCRICGSSISETDTVCKVCGAVQEEEKKPVHNEEFKWTVYDFSRPKKAVEEVKMEWPKEPERPARVNLDEPISFDIDIFKKRSSGEKLPGEEKRPAEEAANTGKESAGGRNDAPEFKIPAGSEPAAQGGVQRAKEAPVTDGAEGAAAAQAREESLRKVDPFFDFSRTNIAFQDILDQEYAKLQKRKEGVPYVETQWRYQPEERVSPELPEHPEDALERMIREGTRTVNPSSEPTIQVDLGAIKRAAARRYGYDSEGLFSDGFGGEPMPMERQEVSRGRAEAAMGAGITAKSVVVDELIAKNAVVDELVAKNAIWGEAAAKSDGEDKPAAKDAVTENVVAGNAAAEDAVKESSHEEEPCRIEDIFPPETKPEEPVQKFKKRRTMTEMERAREEYFRMLDEEMGGVQVQVKVNTPYGQAGKVVTDVDIQTGQSMERRVKHAPVYEEPENLLTGRSAGTEPSEPSFVQISGEQTGKIAAGGTAAAELKEAAAALKEASTERGEENSGRAAERGGIDAPVYEEAEAVLPETKLSQTPVVQPAAAKPSEEASWPVNAEEEEEKQGGGFFSALGKILLVLIAIAIALELTALGILYFAPESSAAETVYSVQEKVVGWITSIRGNNRAEGEEADDGQKDQNQSEDLQTGEDPNKADQTTVDPLPMADKAALIATQSGRNKNIGSVTANEALGYKSGVDYGNADLNSSVPISVNVWYTDESGNPVYYDREVVGTLIAFNSQWIDYVNSGDKAVLNLIKEGSRAYENAVGFSKVGKVKEEFSSLEIGEIRQGAQGFYLWVQEKIKLTENGTSSTAEYQWVYCLEAVDKQMKIVDYINVKDK